MWIAVAVPAAIVVGMVVWWLRRDIVGVEAAGQFEVERKWGWELRLAPEAEAAFMEGLRAYNDGGNRLAVDGERAVLTTYDPPRLISLHLLADGFAARGDAALHDPQDTVAALIDRLAGDERPGVLHLRPGRLSGEGGDIDPARFTEAVREIVCAGQAEGVVGRSVDESLGAVQVTVLGEPSVARGEGPAHVNGRQVPEAAGPATAALKDRTAGPDGAPGRRVNTMMLDLARVLDRCEKALAEQPDATLEALMREVAPRLIASGGPGLTWTRPPSQDDLRIVLAATGSRELH
ncbi:hypothetical protein FE391_03925 [Nonomuraea sp. KC401]|uniref:hypothetical protein n=1 Tax=unclassified Nonomuraea TaxID=2593643 RepID=UPI0010FD576B|nr:MULTISPECIES: hypothetical protein [unclassified Nonomuraea]NBE95459.1 hypothetical protein [Nonomuraea sp. K271]TLF83426.1 hypothetical protein FE391_03925 [Nonomuraea sp. KC401]